MTAEPRMEDLLASIRRAIQDDIGDLPSSTAGQSRGVVFKGNMHELRVKADEDASATGEIKGIRDKLNTARAFEASSGEAEPWGLAGRLPHLRPSFAEADIAVAPPAGWDEEPRSLAALAEGRFSPDPGLLSAEAQTAAGNAFNRLAHSLLDRPLGDKSIEDMTRELLRGLLKHWLDANLPALVERLVREEIERVGRRGR